jgi:hypothetical protein
MKKLSVFRWKIFLEIGSHDFVTNNITTMKLLLRRTLVRSVLLTTWMLLITITGNHIFAQQNYVSKVWVADKGNGTY